MLGTFQATLSPMLVMLMCMIIGYIAKKSSIVPDNTATVLSKLENYFLVPALIIKNFMEYCTIESITEQYKLILYCLIALVIALAIALPLRRVHLQIPTTFMSARHMPLTLHRVFRILNLLQTAR